MTERRPLSLLVGFLTLTGAAQEACARRDSPFKHDHRRALDALVGQHIQRADTTGDLRPLAAAIDNLLGPGWNDGPYERLTLPAGS